MRLSLITLCCLLVMTTASSDDTAVNKVLDCMRANIPQTVRIQTVEIVAKDRSGGERMLKGKLYGTRENNKVRTMMRIEAPSDLNGASYLVREADKGDEMYMFLPALNKVRRITGASVDGQLWGTDLSYGDLKQLQNAFSGANVKPEPSGTIENRPVHVLSFAPRKEDVSRYNLIRAHVDQQTCVALKVEFHEGNAVRKMLTASPAALKQSGKHWYVTEALVRDVKDLTQTRLRVLGVSAGDKLAGRYFNPQSFYLGQ